MHPVGEWRQRPRRINRHGCWWSAVMLRYRCCLDHIMTGLSVGVHLLEQSVILRPQAVILPPDGVQIIHNLTQLRLSCRVGFTVVLESFDVIRSYKSSAGLRRKRKKETHLSTRSPTCLTCCHDWLGFDFVDYRINISFLFAVCVPPSCGLLSELVSDYTERWHRESQIHQQAD